MRTCGILLGLPWFLSGVQGLTLQRNRFGYRRKRRGQLYQSKHATDLRELKCDSTGSPCDVFVCGSGGGGGGGGIMLPNLSKFYLSIPTFWEVLNQHRKAGRMT